MTKDIADSQHPCLDIECCKSPRELYNAIRDVPSNSPDLKAVYDKARDWASGFVGSYRSSGEPIGNQMPGVPPLNTDPWLGLQETKDWCKGAHRCKEQDEAIDYMRKILRPPPDYPFPKGKLINDLEQFEDGAGASFVDRCRRLAYEVDRWVNEEMTPEIIRYYIYGYKPCQKRICFAIGLYIEEIIGYLQYHKPELAAEVENLNDGLVDQAKRADEQYETHREVDLWGIEDATGIPINDAVQANANPGDVKDLAASLKDKLLHIASMVYKDLAAGKPAEPAQNPTTGRGGRIAAWLWELYERTLKVVIDAILQKRSWLR